MSPRDPIILIPSYRPDNKLVKTLSQIRQLSDFPIVLVDDGNQKKEEQNLFLRLADMQQVHVLHHARNKGKGSALKTGMAYIKQHFPASVGLVTADADGQHGPQDIVRLAERLSHYPHHLILGVREFSGGDVPFRSRFGNQVTSVLFRLATGIKCQDTQTGLRGLPQAEIAAALAVKGERFEYEMNQLLDSARRKVPFDLLPIDTIYINDNETSHYNPLLDSIKILAAIGKFSLASLAGTGVDLVLFALLSSFFLSNSVAGLLLASVLARLVSGLVNYSLNVKWVFQSQVSSSSLFKYGLLFFSLMLVSSSLVALGGQVFSNQVLVKLLVDSFLFLISYKVQQKLVFQPQKKLGGSLAL